MWGAFPSLATLQLASITACMDSAEYIEVQENRLLLYLRPFHSIPLTYQQKNAAIQRINATKALLGAASSYWSGQPDLRIAIRWKMSGQS
jgi:hypothetical protein